MYTRTGGFRRKLGTSLATMALAATVALAGDSKTDDALAPWLGSEYTVISSTLSEHMPTGGKLTFVFDGADNVVRVCTRTVGTQRGPWNMDFKGACAVTLTFTRGTRYCTFEDVKTGNAELLASCHRLRARDVAMLPPRVKGTVELNDLIAFLVVDTDGKKAMSILVDSPSRMTDEGSIVIKF